MVNTTIISDLTTLPKASKIAEFRPLLLKPCYRLLVIQPYARHVKYVLQEMQLEIKSKHSKYESGY